MPDGEFRKLQVTGGSTMIVSLPKTWVRSNQLGKGDIVSIEELATGDLRISPMQGKDSKTCISIDCCMLNDGLADLLIGAYLTGTNTIDVTCKQPIPRTIRTEIRDFLRDTRGMEIEEDDERRIRIVSILNLSELRLQVSINRMYILISSLVNDAFEVLGGDSDELLSDIQDRERQIDARRLLVERQVASAIKNPSVEKGLNLDRYAAVEHANIARVLERMGDHAARLALLVRENSHLVKTKTTEMPLQAIPTWSQELKTLVHNMYTKDVSIIHQAKTSLVQLIEDIEASESDLWTGRKSAERLFCEFRISESIRRLCAYGINFAEALLNMLMNEQLESV